MNIQSKSPMTPHEFLRWNEGREGKREFVRGRVVEMMIQVTRNHASIASNLVIAFGRRIDLFAFSIGSADFAVATENGVRYPDMYVDRKGPASRGIDLAATEPVFLAEILSSFSMSRDFVEKLSDYQSLPSLLHYMILSQEDARIWLWSRTETGQWGGAKEISGADEEVVLSGLAITVPLDELYAGTGK